MSDANNTHEGASAHFGFETIPEKDKQGRVDEVFDRVARRYDLMNDLMSAGLHRVWKAAMVNWLMPPRGRAHWHVLDVAGGTGDIAFRIAEAAPQARITVADVNANMLDVGRARAERQGLSGRIGFVQANAEALDIPDRSMDAYTIAFGIRNVTRIEVALAEAYRVLKPGGRFLCLEFSRVEMPVLDRFYDAYSFNVIPALGKAVAGDGEPYRYLVESIRRFPDRDSFAQMIRHAGFDRVSYRAISGGIAVIHSGWRL